MSHEGSNLVSQRRELLHAAQIALKAKYGVSEVYGRNNQFRADLPNGKRAIIKTGSKGQVMQGAHGIDVDSQLTGVVDSDIVLAAVRNGPNEPIRVYEVTGEVYRNWMTSTYSASLESNHLQPNDLRVLRFDGKGYPEQRVADEWSKYLIDNGEAVNAASSQSTVMSLPEDSAHAIAVAKEKVAKAFGVPVSAVSVTVNL